VIALGSEVVRGDIRLENSLGTAVRDIEVVFHCAGIIHPRKVSDFFEVNTDGTRNLLRAAAKAGVRRFVHVSSNSVAGFNQDRSTLFGESDPPNPYLVYGKSKYLAEQAVTEYKQNEIMETVIVRPCWFYGPGQPARQTRFFTMIKSGQPFLFGNGRNLRSMSYVGNAVQGLLLAGSLPQAKGQTYWVADERPYMTIEIYETISEILGVQLKPRKLPSLVPWGCRAVDRFLQEIGIYIPEIHVAGEMNQNIACSIEKARRELSYSPAVALAEGMRRSIEWCRRNRMDI
jgi:nucleoside-diphosphate-sugar epimerase